MNIASLFQTIYGLFHHHQAPTQQDLNQQNSQAIDSLVKNIKYNPTDPNATPSPTPRPTPMAAQQAISTLRPQNQVAQTSSQFALPDLSKIDQKAPNYSQVLKIAYNIAKQNGLPPAAVIGQIAAEGRGTGTYAKQRNNWLSVQAYTDNPNAAKSYPNVAANLQDYANLIKKDPRYTQAWANRGDPTAFAKSVANAGYATDPNYFNNVTNSPEFKFYNSLH